ncbi:MULTISPECIES: serine hydrolase [unclassified Duganella]|uniref:serine hydrolase domain-containing protein n=1 Tax=unclassified Duganella TaxID=2636909 RepID=UPI000E3523B3|nr:MULTISPECIES: serine hydrolase domain-containing protein [unclassified Duganella]RFP14763.1 class A beta-lactamase-related serine hydrolase [Duganella sp. BJB475]RFP31112.1 class A beta-lactamase-related serine hydrolase [Duganella sp. BJB476]
MTRCFVRICLACFALSMSVARAQDEAGLLMARVEAPLDAQSLPALMERLHVPGVSIAVIKDFKLHWAKGYGVADMETGRLVDTETRFQAASISKPVTALAAMRLVQEHKLDLDADVNTMLKSWRVPASELTRTQAVTPRSLFSHTSGADDGFGFPGYAPGAPLPSLVQILDGRSPSNVGKVVFARAPFEAYKYSGGGLVIMQLALTELTGLPFERLMQSTVLAPLRMSNSSFEQPSYAALAHDAQGRRMEAPWKLYPEQAAAGLWTTPSDLAKFIIEIQTGLRGAKGMVLEPRYAREMLSPAGVGPYAVGLTLGQRGDGWYFTHSGSNWGYRAWISGHVRKGYGVVIMANGDNGMALMNQIADRVATAYHWDTLEKPVAK